MKEKYNVYRVESGTGCYGSSEKYIGSTYAVSAKQAVNNVRFRTGNRPAMDVIGDYLEEGHVVISYRAELA